MTAWKLTHLVFVERSASCYCQDSNAAVKASIPDLIGQNRFTLSGIRPGEISGQRERLSRLRLPGSLCENLPVL